MRREAAGTDEDELEGRVGGRHPTGKMGGGLRGLSSCAFYIPVRIAAKNVKCLGVRTKKSQDEISIKERTPQSSRESFNMFSPPITSSGSFTTHTLYTNTHTHPI